MNIKSCKRCLLREFDNEAYMNNLHEYILHINEEEKTLETDYEERLGKCKECDYLMEGMCRACGCYVELRAALKDNACPYEKW